MLDIRSASRTHVGGREVNEDAALERPDLGLFVLADGAGGQGAGDIASELALVAIASAFEASAEGRAERADVDSFGLYVDARRLVSAIQRANRAVMDRRAGDQADAAGQADQRGMGTTVVAALPAASYGAIHVAHVGDSRCYRWRDGLLELLTEDHSLLHDVLEMWPDMGDDVLKKLPRNVVTRALGMQEPLRVTVRTFELLAGDRYLLCSDGVTEALAPARISALLGTAPSVEGAAEALVEAAREAGARDNITALVVVCAPSQDAEDAPPPPSVEPAFLVPTGERESVPPHGDDEPEIVILGELGQEWREALDELTRKA